MDSGAAEPVKSIGATKALTPPVIDGRLHDQCWRGVEKATGFSAAYRADMPAAPWTVGRVVYDDENLYIGVYCHEPEMAVLREVTENSTGEFAYMEGETVEIFLDVTGERSGFHQFIVNPNGALYDGKDGDTSWNSTGVKAATQVGEDAWTLEVFIPIATFQDAVAPGTGVQWFGNFTRHRVTDRKAREYQRLNTTYTGSSSDQNAFGPLRFIER